MEVQNDPSERQRSRLFSEPEDFVMPTIEFRSWLSLPIEIMESIMRRLYYSDHLQVRAVCKGWHSMRRVPPLKQLPWLILWGKKSCRSFKLIDPQYNKVYTLDMETTVLQGRDLTEIQICASKNSWFLMSSSSEEHVYSFVVYSPFMNRLERIIGLPKLNSDQKIRIATFSTNPSSPGCLYFTLSYDNTTVDISTCRRGDIAWTIATFNNNNPMHEPFNTNVELWVANVLWGVENSLGEYSNVAYLDGKFYWASLYPKMVGTYSLVEEDYHLYEYPPFESLSGSVHFVKTDEGGKILLVQMENRGRGRLRCPRHTIYRLDHLQMTWTKVDRLDDQVLCVGYHNDATALSVEDRETKNKVYLCRDRSIKYFEINSERYCCLFQYIAHNDLEYCQRIYIEPPSQEDGFAG